MGRRKLSPSTKKAPVTPSASSTKNDSLIGFVSLVLLAFQFGLQPLAFKKFVGEGVTKSSVVLSTELVKVVIAFVMMTLSGDLGYLTKSWVLKRSIILAAIPAGIYAVQNITTSIAYQNVDAMSFNLLNQTKILFTALCLFMVMGKKQSPMQIVALLLVMVAAFLVSYNPDRELEKSNSFWWGIVPALLSAVFSGMASTLCQRSLQSDRARPAPLFTVELAFYGSAFLLSSLLFSSDGQKTFEFGFFNGWNAWTLVPVVLQASGGVIVGLVIRYAGSVRKGFAVVFGVLITGFAEWWLYGRAVSNSHWAALGLVMCATYLHSSFPVQQQAVVDKKKQ